MKRLLTRFAGASTLAVLLSAGTGFAQQISCQDAIDAVSDRASRDRGISLLRDAWMKDPARSDQAQPERMPGSSDISVSKIDVVSKPLNPGCFVSTVPAVFEIAVGGVVRADVHTVVLVSPGSYSGAQSFTVTPVAEQAANEEVAVGIKLEERVGRAGTDAEGAISSYVRWGRLHGTGELVVVTCTAACDGMFGDIQPEPRLPQSAIEQAVADAAQEDEPAVATPGTVASDTGGDITAAPLSEDTAVADPEEPVPADPTPVTPTPDPVPPVTPPAPHVTLADLLATPLDELVALRVVDGLGQLVNTVVVEPRSCALPLAGTLEGLLSTRYSAECLQLTPRSDYTMQGVAMQRTQSGSVPYLVTVTVAPQRSPLATSLTIQLPEPAAFDPLNCVLNYQITSASSGAVLAQGTFRSSPTALVVQPGEFDQNKTSPIAWREALVRFSVGNEQSSCRPASADVIALVNEANDANIHIAEDGAVTLFNPPLVSNSPTLHVFMARYEGARELTGEGDTWQNYPWGERGTLDQYSELFLSELARQAKGSSYADLVVHYDQGAGQPRGEIAAKLSGIDNPETWAREAVRQMPAQKESYSDAIPTTRLKTLIDNGAIDPGRSKVVVFGRAGATRPEEVCKPSERFTDLGLDLAFLEFSLAARPDLWLRYGENVIDSLYLPTFVCAATDGPHWLALPDGLPRGMTEQQIIKTLNSFIAETLK